MVNVKNEFISWTANVTVNYLLMGGKDWAHLLEFSMWGTIVCWKKHQSQNRLTF